MANTPEEKPDNEADTPKRPRINAGPECPKCSTDESIVTCTAGSSAKLVTYYYCPNRCGFSVQLIRPDYKKFLKNRPEEQEGFGAR